MVAPPPGCNRKISSGAGRFPVEKLRRTRFSCTLAREKPFARSKSAVQRIPDPIRATARSLVVESFDLHNQVIAYEKAWKWQQTAVQQLLENRVPAPHDKLLLLQHEPVFTLGAGSTETNLNFALEAPPLPLHRTERGGEVTYHGPGQLVLYPVLNLQQYQADLHWYLRSLEEVAIRAIQNVSGFEGKRIDGLTGVWIDDKKVAAVGIRARRWVTYHGIALNVALDLEPYKFIVPCGIADKPVTSIQQLTEERGDISLQSSNMLQEYAHALLRAFEEVFDVNLIEPDLPAELL